MEFIRSYENTLSDELLSNLIMLATNQVTWKSNRHNNRTDKQMAIEPFWPDLASEINHSLLRCFDSYLEEFPYLKELGEDWMSGHIILQQTNLDRLSVNNEIEKIQSISINKRITKQDLEQILDQQSNENCYTQALNLPSINKNTSCSNL